MLPSSVNQRVWSKSFSKKYYESDIYPNVLRRNNF